MNTNHLFNILLVLSFLLSNIVGTTSNQNISIASPVIRSIDTVIESMQAWVESLKVVTITQGNTLQSDMDITETPTPGFGATPTDEPTFSPTATITITVEPTIIHTPMPTGTITATITPTITTTPSTTPTSTMTPTTTPTPGPTLMPEILEVSFEPDVAAPGDVVTATWSIKNYPGQFQEAELWAYLPEYFIPINSVEGNFDSDSNLLIMPMHSPDGILGLYVEGSALPPYKFLVEIHRDDQVITSLNRQLGPRGPDLVDVEGGQARGFNQRVKVNFPAGALPETADVMVRAPRNPDISLGGRPMELTAMSRANGKEIKKFKKPITITVQYTDEEAERQLKNAGMKDETSLSLFYYDETQENWYPLPTRVDEQANQLIATSTHFSIMDFKAQNWEAARLPTIDGFQVEGFTGASTYSYPIQVPPGPGGLQPSLELSYNSQVVDAASSRSQASWVGMGWSFDTGYIQRSMNGTPNYLGDDTFTLVMNGVGGLLLPIVDQDGDPNTIDYRLANDNFWRIRQYLLTGNVWGYPGDKSTWVIFSPDGTQYYFGASDGLGGHAWYAAYPSTCDSITMTTWKWGLSKIRNNFGKELTFYYNNELSPSPKHFGNCDGYPATIILALYPDSIVYANNRYRVVFIREGGTGVGSRTDHDDYWDHAFATVFYMRAKLLRIEIWNDLDGSWGNGNERLIRKYVLGYDENGQQIFPGNTWPAGGKTPTLTSVTEYGMYGANTLPKTEFFYDGIHMDYAKNGYGGRVEFDYDIYHADEGFDKVQGHAAGTLSGEFYPDTSSPYGDDFDWLKSYYQPGNYYKIEAKVMTSFGLSWAKLGIDDGTAHIYGAQIALIPDTWNTITSYIRIAPGASQARPLLYCKDTCKLNDYKVYPLVTRYQTTVKTITDEVTSSSYVYQYSYEGTAVNDTVHSYYVQTYGANYLMTKPNTEFRGSNHVTETDPDGKVIESWHYQDDTFKGLVYNTQEKNNTGGLYTQLSKGFGNWDNSAIVVLPHPQGQPIDYYKDLKLVGTYTTVEEERNYNANSPYIATRNEYQYLPSDQSGSQYGNRTRTISSYWNGSSWVTYRGSKTGYYPTITNGTPENARYLTGLPGYTDTFTCPGGCDWAQEDLIGSLWYLYDGNSMNYNPFINGQLSGNRIFIKYNAPNLSDYKYADTKYTYDAWGNRTSITQYIGVTGFYDFGTGSDPQTTYTCYGAGGTLNGYECVNDTYYTYPEWERDALNHKTTFAYDIILSVPTSVTDPNNVTTSATYDAFGRLISIIRPGDDSSNPTATMSYHEASGNFANNPFWTEARQRITGSTYFTMRKYYNGIGQLIQNQVVGATIGTQTRDILTDTFYEAGGRVYQQTVAYDVATGGNYHIRNISAAHTEITYDILGRVKTSLATDETPTASYIYWDGYYNNMPYSFTQVTNARGYQTTIWTDIWGRTAHMVPANGPVVDYSYDTSDRLTDTYRGGSHTHITYDFGGRKTQMDDPDMGTWSYTYDAIGNMTNQIDARGCMTTIGYDALNRPTSKIYSSECSPTPNVTYSYDIGTYGIGRRTGMNDGTGSSSWSYDNRGRMIQEIKVINGSGTFKTSWTYNSADLMTSMTYPGDASGNPGEVVSNTYLPQMLLDTVIGTNTYVNNTDYEPAGRVELRDLGLSGSNPAIRVDYTYFNWTDINGQGRLKQITSGIMSGLDSLQDLRYAYDANGNLLTIQDYKAGSPQTQTFTYDSLDRLTSAKAENGSGGTYPLENYNYDGSTGNMSGKAGLSYNYNTTTPSPAHGVRRSNGTGGSSKTITIRAHSTPCIDGVGATMELWVNGSKIATWTNVGSAWTDYSQNATLSGKDVIDIVFTNDCYQGGYDRNLYVDYVIVDGTTIQAEGGAAIIDRGPGVTAFDGQDVLMGQEGIYWNGALRLVKGDGAFIGGYDGNGNLTNRVVNGAAYLLSYDAENQLVSVNGAVTASFIYNGDGNRVKGMIGSTTITYVGNYLEWKTSTSDMVKYYYAGSTRVAIRTGSSTLNFLLGDHLGSQTITTDSSGALIGEIRYYAWGTERYASGTTPTTYHFTGQRLESYINLYWYGSRWFDPALGRFISPDPIVPGTGEGGNPSAVGYLGAFTYSPLIVDYHENQFLYQLNSENAVRTQNTNAGFLYVPTNSVAFDRYAYSFNNPIRYTDPTGHCPFCIAIPFVGIPGVGWVIFGIATVTTIAYFAVGGPDAFAQTVVDIGEQASQRISDLLTQYRYRGDERTAGEIIGQEKKGSINREFPSDMLGKTADEINRLAREGNRAAQKAQKLLGDQRFDKHQKRGGKGEQ